MLDTGATAWMLAAAALVLFMTLPGLAMYYSGLVRAKSALSIVMQCFSVAALISALWMIFGYTLSFSDSQAGLIGGLGSIIFDELHLEPLHGFIPESLFAVFQMGVALFAAALMVGAYAERMKFSSMLFFSGAWLLLVYAPLTHWTMDESGWLNSLGLMDHAGGLPVLAGAGASALAAARLAGPRKAFPNEVLPPHSPGLAAAGAGIMWVGWLAYVGGAHLAADSRSAMTILVAHIAASAAAVTWSYLEWRKDRKFSLAGTVTGVLAGLAAATPAAGFTGPLGGLAAGAAAAVLCFYMVDIVKTKWRIDDSLSVFAVFGMGSMLGVLLAPLMSFGAIGGEGLTARNFGVQYGVQMLGVLVTVVWAAGLSYLIAKGVDRLTKGIRVASEDEIVGLDIAAHGERAYDYM